MKPKISMVTLGVADLAEAIKFYRDGLGFRTHNFVEGDEMVMFRMEGAWLALFPYASLARDCSVNAGRADFSGVVLSRNEPSVADVDRTYAEALAAGGRPQKAPAHTYWGGYAGYITDKDAYVWEIAYNPHTDLT